MRTPLRLLVFSLATLFFPFPLPLPCFAQAQAGAAQTLDDLTSVAAWRAAPHPRLPGHLRRVLVHCGFTAMGVTGPEDHHPLYGELPNAPYERAFLSVGADERGPYMAVGGEYQHTVAFTHNYIARPVVRLYESEALLPVSMTVTNLKKTDMEYMYMAHVNFRPVDNGRLVYSAECTPGKVRVRRSIPSHVKPGPGFVEYLEELGRHPERHHVLKTEMPYDPEIAFFSAMAPTPTQSQGLEKSPSLKTEWVSERQLNR